MFVLMKISDQILEVRGSEVESLYNLSKIMNTGLDRRVISILLELLELGVHPDSLVDGESYFSSSSFYPNHQYMFLSHSCRRSSICGHLDFVI